MSEKRTKKPTETLGAEAPEAVLPTARKACAMCAEKDAKIAELERAIRALTR